MVWGICRRGPPSAVIPLSGGTAGGAGGGGGAVLEQSRTRVVGAHRLGELLHRLLLLLAELLGNVDHEPIVDVPAVGSAAQLRRPLAAQALDGPVGRSR